MVYHGELNFSSINKQWRYTGAVVNLERDCAPEIPHWPWQVYLVIFFFYSRLLGFRRSARRCESMTEGSLWERSFVIRGFGFIEGRCPWKQPRDATAIVESAAYLMIKATSNERERERALARAGEFITRVVEIEEPYCSVSFRRIY